MRESYDAIIAACEALGEKDFAEARRVKAWLQSHPKADMLAAFLLDRR